METISHSKKQILYPKIFNRVMATLLDMTLISLLLMKVLPYINLYIFKYNFADILAKNNLNPLTPEDLNVLIRAEEFLNKIHPTDFIMASLELIFIQYILFSFYFIFCWVKYGTTLGKLLFKIKIQDYTTGQNPNFFRATIRYFGYLLVPFSIFSCFSKEKRAIHDLLANTIVIKS